MSIVVSKKLKTLLFSLLFIAIKDREGIDFDKKKTVE